MITIGKRLLFASLLAAAGMTYLYAEDGTIRVTEAVLRNAAVSKVKPDYPPMARQLHLSGSAEMDVLVDTTGDVQKVEPKSGNPMFTSAAAAALRKWKFTPFKADGKTVRAEGTMKFDFAVQ